MSLTELFVCFFTVILRKCLFDHELTNIMYMDIRQKVGSGYYLKSSENVSSAGVYMIWKLTNITLRTKRSSNDKYVT